jgi:tetratricopeptide (TPR) repeat protein
MDHRAGSKLLVSLLLAMSVAGCSQEQSSQNAATPVAAEQSKWEQLTAEADQAAKSGNNTEAEAKYKAAMAEAEQLGQTDPAMARSVSNMADFYYAQGDGEKADQLYDQAVGLKEKALGMEHVDLAKDLIGLAKLSAKKGEYAEAQSQYERAQAILVKAEQPVPDDVKTGLAEATAKAGKKTDKKAAND